MFPSPRPLLAAFCATALLVGCGGSATGVTCPPDSTLTADTFGTAFMGQYCTRCHATSLKGSARQGAPSDVNLDTLAGVRAEAQDIDAWSGASDTLTNAQMPPSGPAPSVEERRKLSQWLACGAP